MLLNRNFSLHVEMATMGGVRPAGSDGTDYLHRERVASHYQTRYSEITKTHLKDFSNLTTKFQCS